MQAEVISIGDELTSGQRLDTNTQWLSQQLGELGIRTLRQTTVGDDLDNNIDALRLASRRADIVVCTGGLGPTLDDLTRQAMADAFERPLQLDVESLQRIEAMFARRQRPMPERNRLQAMFPSGSQPIPNPHGSAPGIDLTVPDAERRCRLFALPGVPAEMKQMWVESVVPRIENMLGGSLGRLRHQAIKLFGIGESDVEVRLPELIARQRLPTVGITVSRATITLRIAARAHSDEEFEQLIAPTRDEIRGALGNLIFGEGEDELEHAVLRQLADRQLTMASVEVGAASWVGDWMLKAADTERSPYLGSIAFPKISAAQTWLAPSTSDPPATPTTDTLENPLEVFKTLARQTQQRFRADIGLAIGSYPSATAMQATPTAFDCYFAVALPSETTAVQRNMGGHPDVLGPRIAKTGLDILRHALS